MLLLPGGNQFLKASAQSFRGSFPEVATVSGHRQGIAALELLQLLNILGDCRFTIGSALCLN